MVEEMKLHLEDLGPINSANINISKITVVGGPNASGKSSLSKFLFSFLKANSFNRQEVVFDSFLHDFKQTANVMSSRIRKRGIKDKKVLAKFSSSRFTRKKFKSIINLIDEWYEMREDYNEFWDDELDCDFSENYLDDLSYATDVVEDNSDELYQEIVRELLDAEFPSNEFRFIAEIADDFKKYSYENIEELKKSLNNFDKFPKDSFYFLLNYTTGTGGFLSQGGILIDDVFYIDSISLLDVFDEIRLNDSSVNDHIKFLKDALTTKSSKVFDSKFNQSVIDLERDINSILNGQFVFDSGEFSFMSNGDVKSMINNTASGIKQIGLIQLLLSNRELNDNCVLIIDEPEVNLHPEWQMKLAEILTLIASKLNVSVYINTHSPLFVEAINTFSNYYDLSDKTTYHLAEKSGDGFDISEIPVSELSKLYDNLGRPYLALDMLKFE